MPFDPKLIQPDEPPLKADGDLELPDELQALAEQLSEDAAHLATCYPPQQEVALPAVAAGTRGRRNAVFIVAVTAATLATLLLGVCGIWLGVARLGGRTQEAIVAKSSPGAVTNEGASHSTKPNGEDSIRLPSATISLSLTELSGPELEALLDLIERDPLQAGNVAF